MLPSDVKVFNIYNSMDPLAGRLEPLLHSDVKPGYLTHLPRTKRGGGVVYARACVCVYECRYISMCTHTHIHTHTLSLSWLVAAEDLSVYSTKYAPGPSYFRYCSHLFVFHTFWRELHSLIHSLPHLPFLFVCLFVCFCSLLVRFASVHLPLPVRS